MKNTLLLLALSTPIFMAANVVGGVLIAGSKDEWNEDLFKASLIKYVGLLIMAGLLYLGAFLSEQAIEQILNIELHIKELVLLGIATFASSYALQAINKFKDLTQIKMTEGED